MMLAHFVLRLVYNEGCKHIGMGNIMQEQIHLQITLQPTAYRTLERLAQEGQQSVAQVVQQLIEAQITHPRQYICDDDIPADEIAKLVAAGGAFDWLADEPDLYDNTCGEAV